MSRVLEWNERICDSYCMIGISKEIFGFADTKLLVRMGREALEVCGVDRVDISGRPLCGRIVMCR
jgi:hypothetical protein